MKEFFKTYKNNLMLWAGTVWAISGFNVLKIGIISYARNINILQILISTVVFATFQLFVFSKIVRKHTKRIIEYKDERQFFLKFFDIKSFCIMAFMIALGIVVRASNIFSNAVIVVFYSGIGISLIISGILFFINYIKTYKVNTAD